MALNTRTQFCSQCDNMLYHTVSDSKLGWFCRVCNSVQPDAEKVVCVMHTQIIGKQANIDALVNKYTKHDPNLPHLLIQCPNQDCATNRPPASGADTSKDRVTDAVVVRDNPERMSHIYICTECDHVWK